MAYLGFCFGRGGGWGVGQAKGEKFFVHSDLTCILNKQYLVNITVKSLIINNILLDPIETNLSGVARIFFRGGTPRPLKGYHAPPAGGPEGEGPRTVSKFHFLKRFKVFEN